MVGVWWKWLLFLVYHIHLFSSRRNQNGQILKPTLLKIIEYQRLINHILQQLSKINHTVNRAEKKSRLSTVSSRFGISASLTRRKRRLCKTCTPFCCSLPTRLLRSQLGLKGKSVNRAAQVACCGHVVLPHCWEIKLSRLINSFRKCWWDLFLGQFLSRLWAEMSWRNFTGSACMCCVK